MYSIDEIKKLTNDKQELINNYIKKFIDSRWRDENENYTFEDCLKFLIVQHYIDMVIKLPSIKQSETNINIGCGGGCDVE